MSVEPLDYNIKKELDDWTSMPPEPIDIKPDITLLEGFSDDVRPKVKRRKYPQFKNGIPCEPCKANFPNYVKWIRHTKSHKHQRNVALYDTSKRGAMPGNVPFNIMHQSMVQKVIPPKRPLMVELRQNPCPIGGCLASFKHRRNLVTHVRTHHGYRLKDLEAKIPSAKPNYSEPKAAASESSSANNENGDVGNDAGDESGDVQKKSLFKCSHCPKEFDLRVSLKTHLLMKHRIASVTAKLKCDRCFKSFHRKTGYLSHMRSCGTSVKSRKCPYCLLSFPTYKETVQHKARCPKRYVNAGVQPPAVQPKSFNITPNEDGTYSCEFCNITFEVQSVFCNHMEMYHSGHFEATDKQEDANESTENIQSDEHNASVENANGQLFSADQDADGKFACRYCVKSFEDVIELQDHMSFHDANKIFQCKLCFATLNCKRYFQDHMRSHFIQHRGQYLCWTCFKPFNNRRDLTAHKSMHIQLKIYKCTICNQSFNSILALERHGRVHTDAASNVSTEKLDIDNSSIKNDSKAPNEDSDVEIKEDKINFNCHVCKKNFSSEAALEKHSKLHNPVKMELVKKFVPICNNCKFVFKSSSALRDHMQHCKNPNEIPSNEENSNDKLKNLNRVRCDKCHTCFSTKLSLYKHKKMNRCPLFRTQFDTQYGSVRIYYCRYCKKSVQTVFGLYRHLKSCKIMEIKRRAAGVDANHCIKCRKQFSSLAVLFNHEKFCTALKQEDQQGINDNNKGPLSDGGPSVKFKCNNCNTECHSEESLNRHKKFCKVFGGVATEESITGERFFSSCNVCGRKFTTSLSYKLHKKFCTSNDTPKSSNAVKCRGCGRMFSSRERLKLHERVCKPYIQTPVVMLSKPQQLHTCSCGRVFPTSSQLSTHKETCGQQSYEASSATGSTSSVSTEKSSADRSRVLTCEYCLKQFGKYQARNSHLRVCQVKLSLGQKHRNYTSVPSSTASVTITPGPPPPSSNRHNCVVCKGTFGTEEELIDHSCHEYSLANNLEINNITVEPDLPQEILDMQQRQVHQQPQIPQYLKSPKRVFKCHPCNKIFSGSSALSKHSQLFHGQSPASANVVINPDGSFTCPKCPRSFRDHKSLTHHMGWHTRQGGLEIIETTSSPGVSFPTSEVVISAVESPPVQQPQFTCPVCFRKFLGKGPLQNHIKSHGNPMNNQPVASEQDLNSDLLGNIKRPKGSGFRCKICPKVFKDKLSLINHHNLHKTVSPANSLKAKILSRAGKTYVSCNICHKILSSNSIPKHNKLHRLRQEKPQFPLVSSLQPLPSQMRPKQPSFPPSTLFPCGFCFKLFRHQKALNDHMIESHRFDEQPIPGDKHPQSLLQQQLQQQYQQHDQQVVDEEDDIVLIEEDEQEIEADSRTPTSGLEDEEAGDGQEFQYKCEICDKSWKHRSVYLRHVNAPSHKELTKRLSDILTRVNHDVNTS